MRDLLILLIFIFASIRGFFIINFNLPSNVIYGTSSALILLLGVWGFMRRSDFFVSAMNTPKTLVNINFLFGIFFIVGNFIFGGDFNIAFLYTYFVPYVIFLFISVPPVKIKIGFLIIACAISYSIITNFFNAHYDDGGLQYLLDYQDILRPSDNSVISRTGEFYRIAGYTGSYHDSANLLGMLMVYIFANSLISKNIYYLIIIVPIFMALLMTQSAANIVLALLVSLFVIFSVKYSKFCTILNIFLFVLFLYLINIINADLLVFTERIGYDGDWGGMVNMINLDLLLTPHFWVGFGSAWDSNFMSTEVGYIKLIIEMGIFHAAILFFLLIYPIVFFIKKGGGQSQLLPPLFGIIFGILSLVHYGSLFRSTNVLVFFSMYAIFFNRVVAGELQKARDDF